MDPAFRVNNFDLLRILAAAQVVYMHSIAHLGIPSPPITQIIAAFPGVPVFFALSGYLISASYERTPDLRSYARNRLLRILPALWCVVIVTTAVATAFGYRFLNPTGVVWFMTQLVGLIWTPHFLKSFGFGSYNGSLWTIPIELQFYFLLPLLYAAARPPKRRTATLALAWLVSVVAVYVYALHTPPLAETSDEPLPHKLVRYSFGPHIYLFLTGVLLQRWHAHRSRWIAGRGLFWLAGYIVLTRLVPTGAASYVLCTLVMAVTVISLAFTVPRLAERVLRGNDLSYGVYIYHGLVLNVLIERGAHARLAWLIPVFAATLALAALSWWLVEKPFLRRKRNPLHPTAVATGRAERA